VGDCDGVVVVPKQDADIVFTKAFEKSQKEKDIKLRLEEGISTMEIYHFDEVVKRLKENEKTR